MGAFDAKDVEHYGGSGGAGFFKLNDHGDVARVRILYDKVEDVQGYAVHRVKLPDSKYGRDVNCLRNYNDPEDMCPFCRQGIPQQAMLYIPLYNIDQDEIQLWSRGKTWFGKIASLCSRYPHLVSHVFEIERNGKAGDKKTTYELFEVDKDDTRIEDFKVPKVIGGAILDKTADDMEYYLENGEFPPEEDEEDEVPVRRSRRETSSSRPATRRTPAGRHSQPDEEF